MSILARSNDALKINPPPTTVQHLTRGGSDWLWAVTALDLFCLLAVVGLAYVAPKGEKIFHYLFIVTLLVGTISYYTAASDLGSLAINVADAVISHPGPRQVFYSRYINWFVGWTPMVIAVGLLSGVSWATILYNIVLTWIWIASWLAGALVASTYKWGFFAFGLFSELLLITSLLHTGTITAKRVGIVKHHSMIVGWLSFIWLIYPIAYGVDDGGNIIRVTSGWIFFGVLDILSTLLPTFAILILSRKWDYRALNLYFTQYGRVAQAGEFPEKSTTAGDNAALANPGAPAAADPLARVPTPKDEEAAPAA
ncbi:Heat shock protein 30 [Coleophoma cylindrospora]|uniref:Heat shock protein 30 n=1 Tax=Coleophoma cylindrospora TaxID=1849047 RepID=A0A3D8QC85_9HELO|nr:Heat shock protein 30 [Coleophoma cylindrospora]